MRHKLLDDADAMGTCVLTLKWTTYNLPNWYQILKNFCYESKVRLSGFQVVLLRGTKAPWRNLTPGLW